MTVGNAPGSRRLARIALTPEIIAVLLGLPDDIEARHLAYDPHSDCAILVVESEHLPATPAGDILPAILPQYEHRDGGVYLVGLFDYAGPITPTLVRSVPRVTIDHDAPIDGAVELPYQHPPEGAPE